MKIKQYIPRKIRLYLKRRLDSVLKSSLESALKEQGLNGMASDLRRITPDITDQYSTLKLDCAYLEAKVRGMHAFQVALVGQVMDEFLNPAIVDIGDSSGTHLRYITSLYARDKKIKCLSVNLDGLAVERIKKKGLEALCIRAENLHKHNIGADIFLCFEMLEHLSDPCSFLHKLTAQAQAKYLIITVPYLKNSRVGLHHIRGKRKDKVYPENTHIFELSPCDWKLILRHSGWDIIAEKTYLQYPRKGFFRLTKPLWRNFDFEGFYGIILKRDDAWSSKFTGWDL